MVDGFHHAAIPITDIPRTIEFYEEIVGLEPVGPDDPERTAETATYYWMAVDDDQWVNFAVRPDATPDLPGELDDPHVAFRADKNEVHRIQERLAEHDIDVTETQTSIYFHDPDGNHIEVTHFEGPE